MGQPQTKRCINGLSGSSLDMTTPSKWTATRASTKLFGHVPEWRSLESLPNPRPNLRLARTFYSCLRRSFLASAVVCCALDASPSCGATWTLDVSLRLERGKEGAVAVAGVVVFTVSGVGNNLASMPRYKTATTACHKSLVNWVADFVYTVNGFVTAALVDQCVASSSSSRQVWNSPSVASMKNKASSWSLLVLSWWWM
jgi:hypothetical protein